MSPYSTPFGMPKGVCHSAFRRSGEVHVRQKLQTLRHAECLERFGFEGWATFGAESSGSKTGLRPASGPFGMPKGLLDPWTAEQAPVT